MNPEEYDKNAWYEFTDQNGEVHQSRGDNGYIWQSVTQGVPIYVNDKGDWFTTPYLEVTPTGYVANIPAWFAGTDEYNQWKQTSSYAMSNLAVNKDNFEKLNDTLKYLGNLGLQRFTTYNQGSEVGLVDQKYKQFVADQYLAAMKEGAKEGDANLVSYGTPAGEKGSTAAELARFYKNMSKEELSKNLLKWEYILSKDNTEDSQEEKANVLATYKILNLVADNPKEFGDGKEFEGLLEASEWQKFQTHVNNVIQTVSEGMPIVTFGARLGSVLGGGDWKIENRRDQNYGYLRNEYTGGGLRGTEGSSVSGTVAGSVVNMAGTMAQSVVFGTWLNSTALGSSIGAALEGTSGLTKLGGGMLYDFFANDLPVDLSLFASDLAATGSTSEAWESRTGQTQPLFGLVGPEVPAGLKYNLIGDAVMDLSLPIISIGSGAMYRRLDQATGGSVTKIRNNVAIKNLAIQQKISDLPVIGTGLRKFSDWLMGAENMAIVRDSRKQAIIEGSMTPYISIQNILTLRNHYGAEIVAPLYQKRAQELDINRRVKEFQKNADQYGGMGEIKAETKTLKGTIVETVKDDIPRNVKQGLLDYQRLEELKGEIDVEGGVIANPKRDKEITTLEKRVEEMPEEIRRFAEDFSELNKYVEQLTVTLGLSTQEWVDALMQDPRWKNYMTRQVLLPGGVRGTGSIDPAMNKLLTGKRTGYYNPDQTLSPIMSLDMKVHAIGNAYAWNEQAKAVVAAELSQGKISAGGNAVDLAKRISEKRAEIVQVESVNAQLGYDAIVNGLNDRIGDLTSSVHRINERMQALDNITAKSVYTDTEAPEIKGLIADFNSGKIFYGAGVLDNAGLSPDDGKSIVNNAYIPKSRETRSVEGADFVSAAPNKYAGIASNGVPYEYTIENNQIVSMKKVTTDQGYSDAVSGISGGRFSISTEYVAKIGQVNAAGVNLAVLFYRDNMPAIKSGSSVKFNGKNRNYGYEPNVKNPAEWHWRRANNGHIEIDEFPVYLGSPYRKGQESSLLDSKKRECTPDPNTGIAQKPINTANTQSTPIHEMGHSYMTQLAVAEINRKVDLGEITVPDSAYFIGALVERERNILCETFIKNTMGKLGYDVSGIIPGQKWPDSFVGNVRKEARKGISGYAGDRVTYRGRLVREPSGNPYLGEIFSEGVRYYSGNGLDASPFAMDIISQMSAKGREFSGVINPVESFKQNGLEIPNGLTKNDGYNFPATVKTSEQKAEWLDKWRQKNPYLKREMTEETFQKANLWDSYFQKEVFTYNPNAKSDVPEELLRKSGDFVEKQRAQLAKDLTNEIKRLSGDEFDPDLAMILMGGNGDDIAKAMDNYIIRQIDIEAEKMAMRMDGGNTPDNLATAKLTLWSDEKVRQSTLEMFQALVPDGGDAVVSKVNILFDDQAKGFAAYEKLPVDSKELMAEKEALVEQLYKENKKTLQAGKEIDKNSGFRDNVSHVIHYKEGGEDVYVVTTDPVIANALRKPYDFKETGIITETMQTIANTMATTYRLGTTGLNPMSFIRNVLRDPIQAIVTAGYNPLNMSLSPVAFYKSLRQYGLDDDTIDRVIEQIQNWANASTLTENMRLGPGRANSSYKNRVEQVNSAIRNATNGELVRKLSLPLESWEQFFRNQIGQQSFVKNFQRTGNVDTALASALFDTSNATTNFSHAIGKFKNVTSTIPYLSSAINGTVSFWRLFNIDPVGMVTRITAGFMLPVMAITMWNLSSEENRKVYETLPEWFKQSHIVLADPSGNIIAFPLPEEIQQFAGTARKLIEYTNDVSPYSIATIAAQGAFGFLPFEVDGFWGDDGSLQLKEGGFQLLSGLIPQAFTTLYEWAWKHDLFTGEDLSTYSGFNQTVNALSNIFGTGIKQVINSIGIMAGASESDIIGKSFQDTIARDLFGMGFDAAKNQFASIVGKPGQLREDGKMTQPTGLFKENEDLKKKVDALSAQIASAPDEEKAELENKKQQLIDEFVDKVKNVMDKYQRMFSLTGGLEDWQKNRLVQLLTIGDAWSSSTSDSYQSESAGEASLNERGLAMQRYVQAGLPAGPDQSNLTGTNSIELQAALNRLYGGPKQAATDYRNAVANSGLKDIRTEFYNVISQIYDAAEEQNKTPDYDMIEKIQARYLQAVDAVLIPIINQYGINVLNNSDFIDAVRKQVNGMIPSDDWRQSIRNAKKFLSSKDFPTTTVDVKKWLIQRYSSGMRNRNISSDPEVVTRLQEIKADIDAGRKGSAQGKVKSLMNGVNKANYYISATDLQLLTQYNNMLK